MSEPPERFVTPLNVLEAESVRFPGPPIFKPCVPAMMAEIQPLPAEIGLAVERSVPFWIEPPVRVIEPEVVCENPPKSSAPPAALMDPVVDKRLLPPERLRVPPVMFVPPE